MVDIKKVADAADMIINGYAYTKDGQYVWVLFVLYVALYCRSDACSCE